MAIVLVENKVYNPVPHLEVGDRIEILKHPTGTAHYVHEGEVCIVTEIKRCGGCNSGEPKCQGVVGLKTLSGMIIHPSCYHYGNNKGFLFYALKHTSLDNAEI